MTYVGTAYTPPISRERAAYTSTQPSPTEAILNLWEARNRESTAVAGLVNTLRGMARHDAAQVLDMDTSWP